MKKLESLEKEIKKIKKRNQKVEADKARETSRIRRISIAVLTYFVVALFFYIARIQNARINAIVPTIGFLLSTMSISILKDLRVKRYFGKKKK